MASHDFFVSHPGKNRGRVTCTCKHVTTVYFWVVFSGHPGFLRHDITEILLKVALNTINQPTFLEAEQSP